MVEDVVAPTGPYRLAYRARRGVWTGALPGGRAASARQLPDGRVAIRAPDEEGLAWVARLLQEEGLCLGLSSGINVAGAVALGRQLGPGAKVVTILCDAGFRYLSTLYSAEWLASKNLPVFDWLAAD